jgi:glycosyltransferase involved in cell wall biosynthesis
MGTRADWYIAHGHGALPIAAAAARRWRGRVGFDCEDLLTLSGTDPVDLVQAIENAYVPQCHYVSFPSRHMSEVMTGARQLREAVVLRNVFPSQLANGLREPSCREPSTALRVHWFSQSLTTGRGVAEAIEAVGQIKPGAVLTLRGNGSSEVRRNLHRLAERAATRIEILPLVEHDEIVRATADFDVGLASEDPGNENSSRTFSNKMGVYLLSGLAVAAAATPGVEEVFDYDRNVGFRWPATDVAALQAGLQRLSDDPQLLIDSKVRAWNAARDRFCWDREESVFLRVLE